MHVNAAVLSHFMKFSNMQNGKEPLRWFVTQSKRPDGT